MPTEKHPVIESNAPLFKTWFATRGGIAIWGCLDMANPSQTWSTPINNEDGTPKTKPHWSATDAPIRLITDMDEVVVDTPKEVKRFHVAVRRGSSGMSYKLTDASTAKVRRETDKAGDTAWYEFDYGTQEAVILVPGKRVSLKDWPHSTDEA